MGTISTGIELNDNFSSVLYNSMGSVNLAIYQMEECGSLRALRLILVH